MAALRGVTFSISLGLHLRDIIAGDTKVDIQSADFANKICIPTKSSYFRTAQVLICIIWFDVTTYKVMFSSWYLNHVMSYLHIIFSAYSVQKNCHFHPFHSMYFGGN